MADKKISQLTGATTPLAGTEVLPIVQGGSTVKVAVSDLTAGRTVAASILNPAVGGVGAPSVTFGTDSTSGFYRNSPNQVSFASSGAVALTIGPTTLTLTGGITGGSGYQASGFSGYRANGASISSPGDASIYFNTTTGQTLQARAGSSYDWSLINPGNANYIARVPTGTLDFEVSGGNVKIGTSGKGIIDTNGNESLLFTATASAVNELTVANAATGNNPAISSTGGDTNIGLRLNTKGSGPLSINGPLNRFVASGTNADTTVAATISFVSQSTDWISQLIEFRVALSSTAGSSVHGGVVRYILSSLDSGTGLASVTALASDLTGVTAATSVSGNNLTVTFTITGGGNCNRYGISAEVLSSNGAGWWASGMTVA